ncbi:MAG: tetratricopeptide repeat protein [Nitrospira sp.]|jgi:tetratricopeptide (TPR) repeat protein|nr:tetratricopeptide repeat protein [Nitrospira sp.]
MRHADILLIVVLLGAFIGSGCQSIPKRMILPAPAGTNAAAARHHDEGTHAYQQSQWERAKQHFDAAIAVAPEFAEAHYNLGMTLYQLKAMQEGDAHFIKAANLAPGNKVIWDAPPLKGVTVLEKEVPGMSSDGHMHKH